RALIADSQRATPQQWNRLVADLSAPIDVQPLRLTEQGLVRIYATVHDTTPATLAGLARHGLDVEILNEDFRVVQGLIPLHEIDRVASEAAIVAIRPRSYGMTEAGSVTSQGDSIHRCDQVHNLGLTGAGVKVGVVSGGVSGLAAAQASGNLPAVQVFSSDP